MLGLDGSRWMTICDISVNRSVTFYQSSPNPTRDVETGREGASLLALLV